MTNPPAALSIAWMIGFIILGVSGYKMIALATTAIPMAIWFRILWLEWWR